MAKPVLAIAAMLASIGCANAQDWPTRAITMVVPVTAGSSSDIVGRILAQRLSEVLGQPVIVENAGGAGGTSSGATGSGSGTTAPGGTRTSGAPSASAYQAYLTCLQQAGGNLAKVQQCAGLLHR